MDEENYISALVDERSVQQSLQRAGYSEDSLRATPSSSIPFLQDLNLNCLHGLHRILAAKDFLDEDDQWWTVKLFSNSEYTPLMTQGNVCNMTRSTCGCCYSESRKV